jgi:small subunit ribosomal protein S6|uniref:Small ribosomal subunit protein bS6 n=1 Tax=Desulfobacca acetoxidans TaxID=60893 RepID=A0A7C3WKG4_9BACT
MRRYETVWVVNGDLPDEEVKSTIDKFTNIITNRGGTLIKLEEWGRKKLAYKIGNTLRGYYVIADFAGLPETVKELERNYRIDDRIIRYLTFKKADKVNLEAIQAEISRAKEAREVRAPAEEEAAPPYAEIPPAEAEEAESEIPPEGEEE